MFQNYVTVSAASLRRTFLIAQLALCCAGACVSIPDGSSREGLLRHAVDGVIVSSGRLRAHHPAWWAGRQAGNRRQHTVRAVLVGHSYAVFVLGRLERRTASELPAPLLYEACVAGVVRGGSRATVAAMGRAALGAWRQKVMPRGSRADDRSCLSMVLWVF